MGVGLIGQTEVSDVVGTVNSLPQRSQHHRLQQLRIGAVLDLFQQLRIVACVRLVTATQTIAEFGQKRAQFLELLRSGAFVHAIQRRLLARLEKLGSAHVRCEHAFLDQPMRVVAHFRHDALDLAVVVEDHARFGGLEIDRTAQRTRLEQEPEQLVEVLQVRQKRFHLPPLRFVALVQDGRNLVVGQARVRVHHGRVEAVGLDLPVRGKTHVAGHAQAFDMRYQ